MHYGSKNKRTMIAFKSFLFAFLACAALAENVPSDHIKQATRRFLQYIDKSSEDYMESFEKLEAAGTKEILEELQEDLQETLDTFKKYLTQKTVQSRCGLNAIHKLQLLVDATEVAQAACMKDTLDKIQAIRDALEADIGEIRAELDDALQLVNNCSGEGCVMLMAKPTNQMVAIRLRFLKANQDVEEVNEEVTAEAKSCLAENRSIFREEMKRCEADLFDCPTMD